MRPLIRHPERLPDIAQRHAQLLQLARRQTHLAGRVSLRRGRAGAGVLGPAQMPHHRIGER